MKHSIRAKLIYLITSVLLFIIVLMWILNKGFLKNFYMYSKVKAIDKTYEMVQDIYNNSENNGILDDEQILALQRIASKNNVNIYIFEDFLIYIFTNYLSSSYMADDYDKKDTQQINSLIKEYWYSGSNPELKNKKTIKSTNEYKVYTLFDSRVQSNYLDLVNDSKTIILRTNFEMMKESTNVSNKFLAYIGMLAISLGVLVIFILSKEFTRPILELATIAEKISCLNFEEKYMVKTSDEIGQLGNNINNLSSRLESTISELKQANNELLTDINNKNKIDYMRQEFLSNVSHELKTPISLIQGYAEGLKENINDDSEGREFYCEVIIDEAHKMNELVKKLLSLNQIEFGNAQINIERFDIVDLIKSVLDSTMILMEQKKVLLHYEEKQPIYVWSDKYLIEDVIINYINNAINHVQHSGIIEVKVIEMNNLVRVAVFNTGENIPEEDMDKIWDKFYKVDKSRTREYGGSGIGLSIVKAIMNSLNHDCGAINRKVGVEFWFELDKNI